VFLHVRVPASFCRLFGFRPNHDAILLTGVIPFAPSYDTIGWFARDMAGRRRAPATICALADPQTGPAK
jgi:amidase